MILALDVGNSNIFGGVFSEDKLRFQFRKSTATASSSDEMGLFLKTVLRENQLDPTQVHHIAICSVVPDVIHSLRNCCKKYFNLNPFFLQPGVKTGLKIKYRNPIEVGADRIANAIAAVHRFPDRDLLILDFGTATTVCAINAEKDYLGGSIMPGLRISMEALESQTAKLPLVEIVVPKEALAKSTIESIQSGLYFGAVGAAREICHRISKEAFDGRKPYVIGTGGFASLLAQSGIFDIEVPDLVLQGLYLALKMNS